MFTIRGDDGIVGGQRLHHADGDGLLADVEVEEAADRRRAVQLDAAFFEAADADHLA